MNSDSIVMKLFALVLALTFAVAFAQVNDLPIDGVIVQIPCCTQEQTNAAINSLRKWILSHQDSCDPLIACLFKCLKVSIITKPCPISNALHVSFNKWLLDNYLCLPRSLLQCVKDCIRYNSWPPCPIRCSTEADVSTTSESP